MIDSTDAGGAGSRADFQKKGRKGRGGVSAGMPEAHNVDRLPPHSIEAEQGVLGCVLLAPNEGLGICIEKFKKGSEVFYDLRHQVIFDLLAEMYDSKEPIDLITVQQKLKDKGQLDSVGGDHLSVRVARLCAFGGEPRVLPGDRAGEAHPAEDDPDLHAGGGAGL